MKAFRNFLIFSLLAIALSSCSSLLGLGDDVRDQEMQSMQQTMAALEAQLETLAGQGRPDEYLPGMEEPVEDLPPAVAPTEESLPTEPVLAGESIIYDGWALTMVNEIDVSDDLFYLSFMVRNMTDIKRVFRLIKTDLRVTDNLGNLYPYYLRTNGCRNNPDTINLTHQMSISGEDSVEIDSYSWDGCTEADNIPPFEGRIPIDAEYLIVTIDNWGPFNGIEFHLDL